VLYDLELQLLEPEEIPQKTLIPLITYQQEVIDQQSIICVKPLIEEIRRL
jgi:hypothetical protein